MIFNLPPICGLFPLLLYIVLAFKKGMHPLVNVSICAVVGAIMVKTAPERPGRGDLRVQRAPSWPWWDSSSCWAQDWAWC